MRPESSGERNEGLLLLTFTYKSGFAGQMSTGETSCQCETKNTAV